MSVKETSRSAYIHHVSSGKAMTQRERIMDFLERHQMPRNRRQIAQMTGIPINAVCGRVNTLLEDEQLHVAYIDKDETTGKRVEFLEPKPQQARLFG